MSELGNTSVFATITPFTPAPEDSRTRIGSLELTDLSCRAYWKGHMVKLTFAEFRVVKKLALAKRDLSYQEIYEAYRPEGFTAGRNGSVGANIRTIIKRLRWKFARVDTAFDAVRSYSGFGYRWQEYGVWPADHQVGG